jgi:hypothetical protein
LIDDWPSALRHSSPLARLVAPVMIVAECWPPWHERTRDVRKRGITEGFLSGFGLTCVRIALGYFWLSRVVANPPPTFGCPGAGFCLMVDQAVQSPWSPLFGTLLAIFVQPHLVIFAWLSTLFQVAIGLSLLLGILTRFGAFIGLLWCLASFVGMAGVPGQSSWYYLSGILLSVVFFAIGGSNQLSVDLFARWRTWWGEA